MWKSWSTGVDYVTATANWKSGGAKTLTEFGIERIREQKLAGYEVKPRKWKSYIGRGTEGVTMMSDENYVMLQLSGSNAHRWALMLREERQNFNVKRIDFQHTAHNPGEPLGWEYRLYQRWLDIHISKGVEKLPLHNFDWHGRRGATFYCGSRHSDIYGRFYDKTAEQRHMVEPGLHRAEVETHDDKAALLWETLCNASSVQELSHTIVRSFCKDRKIPHDWLGGESYMRMPTNYEPTDDERRLNWLRSHVSKTASKLVSSQGRESVLKALRLETDENDQK